MSTEELRVGIVGFGSRGTSLVPAILNNSLKNTITTIIDPDIKRCKYYLSELVSQGAIPKDEADNIRFIKGVDELKKDEVNVLFLTASEIVRVKIFEDCIKTGAHIFTDKAIAPDSAGAKKVVKAMDKVVPGQKVFMGFNLRHFPALVQVKKFIDEGRIGRIMFIQYLEMLQFYHGRGFFMRFHRDAENSGGMLVTKSCHDFDLMSYMLGDRPKQVFSKQDNMFFGRGGSEAREQCSTCDRTDDCKFDRLYGMKSRKEKRKYAHIYLDEDKVSTDGYMLDLCCWRDDTDCRDLSTVMLDYDGGVQATYTQLLFAPHGNRIIKFFGTDGSLEFNEHDRSVIIKDRFDTCTDKIITAAGGGSHGGADTGIINDFFADIRRDREPQSKIEDGVWALATAEAAYESNDTGQWVKVRPYFDRVYS
ncbi:MAG: Gfo/Idh/MocA family protein [Planctomycetota bacterium]